ncbi:MAG: glycosyltransferase [Candidatus Acidiferrales bacterium]
MSETGISESVTVVVPSYHRPAALMSCVRSILDGRLRPREIIVVGRQGDDETEQAVTLLHTFAKDATAMRSAWVTVPGHVPPVETGARMASGGIVAIVDDDVTVHSDWLERLVPAFSDPRVGVVGGRVTVPGAPLPKLKGRPGQISWYGKAWGNLGNINGASLIDVSTVMEGNWAWRRDLLASIVFDPVLNFDDASMYGLDLCFQARRKGYRIVYEPRAAVDHHVAARAPELDRSDRSRRTFSYCRNYTYIMLKNSPAWRKFIFLSWTFLVGEYHAWGAAALVADTFARGLRVQRNVATAFRGKMEGILLWLRS